MGTGVLFPRRGARAGRLHLVPTLRMSGAMPLLPLNAFVALIGTVLFSYLDAKVSN